MCFNGVQVEGTAKNLGLVVDEPGRILKRNIKNFYGKAIMHIHTLIQKS